ncbi:MAG TPA: hypothetical protein VJ732_09110, partial [Bryobacteraceae bacterium]|nr:hypothetical protein [Bryobacteraceae bacterium]
PDIFYGTYVPAAENGTGAAGGPRLAPRQGLMDCLTVYGSGGLVDANTASPAVLAAVGVPPEIIDRLVAQRNVTPFSDATLNQFLQSTGAPPVPLRVEGYSIVTMRATARVRLPNGRLSDLKRTVGAQVKYMPPGYDSPIHILRWYDTMWGN